MTVLITGAAKRIGAAITKRLLNEGHSVLLHYYSSETEAFAFVEHWGEDRVIPVYGDLATTQGLSDFLNLLQTKPSFHGFVHSASVFHKDTWLDSTEKDHAASISVHHTAALMISRYLLAQKSRVVLVFILDKLLERATKQYYSYWLGKKALYNLCETLIAQAPVSCSVCGILPSLLLPPEGKSWNYFEALKSYHHQNSATSIDLLCHTVSNVISEDYLFRDFLDLSVM